MKKKFTLVCALCLLCLIPMNGETRIYFAYTDKSEQPLPVEEGLVTVDYRYGNGFKMNNWDNMVGPYNPASGGFVEGGQFGYRQYGFSASKSQFSAIHHLEESAEEKVADLTQVNGDWTLHMAIKTNYEGELLFKFQDKDGAQYSYDITDLVTSRDNTWCELDLEMSDFIEETSIDFKNCIYSSLEETYAKRDIWIIQGTEVTADGEFSWDDFYLTDNGTTPASGIENVAENNEKIIYTGSAIEIVGGQVNELSLYNLSGALVNTVSGNVMNLDNLAKGVYIVKTEKSVFKFINR